jgi:acetyl esterase/lipase
MAPHRRPARILVACVAAATLLAGVPAAPAAAVAGTAPAFTVIKGIEYAPRVGNAHVLDLYLPTHRRGRAPLIIWSAGSAWLGDNGNVGGEVLAEHLAPHGFAVAAVAVRSSTQATFPAQVHDGKAAVRWLRAHARRYHLDPGRFAAMGNSSGGWLAAMLGVTGGVAGLEGDLGPRGWSSRVQAVVDLYGPTDFLQMDEHMLPGGCDIINLISGGTDCHNDPRSPESRLVGCPIQTCAAVVARANPVTYASRDDPPFLILHGTADLLVPHHQSEVLVRALRRACAEVRFASLEGRGHEHGYLDETAPPFTPHRTLASRGCGPTRSFTGPPVTWEALARHLTRTLAGRHRHAA